MKIGMFVSDYTVKGDILERMKAEKLGLILCLNGVYHAAVKEGGKGSPLLEKTSELYAVEEDLQTRGISASDVDSRVKVVSMGDVVDLIMNDYEKLGWL